MMKLLDGPAAGTYMCKRAPLYLRAVVNDKGGTDALDMPSDTPTDLESIHHDAGGEGGSAPFLRRGDECECGKGRLGA